MIGHSLKFADAKTRQNRTMFDKVIEKGTPCRFFAPHDRM